MSDAGTAAVQYEVEASEASNGRSPIVYGWRVQPQHDGSSDAPSPAEGTAGASAAVPNNEPIQLPYVAEPRPVQRTGRFELLQQFEGTVLALEGDQFTARIKDRTTPESGDELATFELSDVSDADRGLLAVGSVFYWSLGYRVQTWGQKERSSMIRFRRLPVWTRTDIERAERQAREWLYMLDRDGLR